MSRVSVVASSISKTKVKLHRQAAYDLFCAILNELWLLNEV